MSKDPIGGDGRLCNNLSTAPIPGRGLLLSIPVGGVLAPLPKLLVRFGMRRVDEFGEDEGCCPDWCEPGELTGATLGTTGSTDGELGEDDVRPANDP